MAEQGKETTEHGGLPEGPMGTRCKRVAQATQVRILHPSQIIWSDGSTHGLPSGSLCLCQSVTRKHVEPTIERGLPRVETPGLMTTDRVLSAVLTSSLRLITLIVPPSYFQQRHSGHCRMETLEKSQSWLSAKSYARTVTGKKPLVNSYGTTAALTLGTPEAVAAYPVRQPMPRTTHSGSAANKHSNQQVYAMLGMPSLNRPRK